MKPFIKKFPETKDLTDVALRRLEARIAKESSNYVPIQNCSKRKTIARNLLWEPVRPITTTPASLWLGARKTKCAWRRYLRIHISANSCGPCMLSLNSSSDSSKTLMTIAIVY
jgi:hypothetical protein